MKSFWCLLSTEFAGNDSAGWGQHFYTWDFLSNIISPTC